jgi:hypothetical protein
VHFLGKSAGFLSPTTHYSIGGKGVTVFLVRTYTVKPDKLEAHNAWGKKLVAMIKKHPELFSGIKSMRVLRHKYGGAVGGFTALWKFESLADLEAFEQGFREVKEKAALREEFVDLLVPGSYSQCVLETVRAIKRKSESKSRKRKR